MNKPIFHYWAHRELWETISTLCDDKDIREITTDIKSDAWIRLSKKYPNIPNPGFCYCFACLAVDRLKQSGKPIRHCDSWCPIYWGSFKGGKSKGCMYDSSDYKNFSKALFERDWERAKELANKIANIPLSKAAKNYDIKKVCS